MARPKKNPETATPAQADALASSELEQGPADDTAETSAEETPRRISVVTDRHVATFWRGGIQFGRIAIELDCAELTDEQLARILGEPMLVVTEL